MKMHKGIFDEGLERIAQRLHAQSDPGVGYGDLEVQPRGLEYDEDALASAESYAEVYNMPDSEARSLAKILWPEEEGYIQYARGNRDVDAVSVEADMFVPNEKIGDLFHFFRPQAIDKMLSGEDDTGFIEGLKDLFQIGSADEVGNSRSGWNLHLAESQFERLPGGIWFTVWAEKGGDPYDAATP